MKAYVQFMETRTQKFNNSTMQFESCTPFEVDCIASNGIFILDGRNSLETMIEDAKQQVKRLQYVKPFISSFKIMKGDLKRSQCVAHVSVHSEQLPNEIKYTFTQK